MVSPTAFLQRTSLKDDWSTDEICSGCQAFYVCSVTMCRKMKIWTLLDTGNVYLFRLLVYVIYVSEGCSQCLSVIVKYPPMWCGCTFFQSYRGGQLLVQVESLHHQGGNVMQ